MRSIIIKYGSGITTNGMGIALSLIAQVVFARMLGPAAYGLLTLTLALVLMPADLVNLGVEPSTARFLAVNIGANRPNCAGAIIRQSAAFMAIIGMVLTVVLLLLATPLARWFSTPGLRDSLWVFALFVPAIYVQKWSFTVLKGLGYITTQIMLQSSVLQILIFGLGVGLWSIHANVEAVVLAYGLAYLVVAILGLGYLFYVLGRNSFVKRGGDFDFREILFHGIPLNIASLAQRLLRRGDTFVIGALLGTNGLGLYRAAYMIASGVKKLITPINSYALFRMSKLFGNNRVDAIFAHYNVAVLFSLTLALPIYLFIFSFAGELIVLLFQSDYIEAVPVLHVLVLGFSVFVSVGPMGALFNAIGKNWLRMWIVLAISILNICLNIVFIKVMGLIGAAIGTSISFVSLYILFLFCMKDKLFLKHGNFIPIALVVLTGIMASILRGITFSTLAWRLALTFFCVLVVFATGAFFTFRYYRMGYSKEKNE